MAKWFEIRKGGNFTEIGKACGISPILARVIRNRGVIGPEETKRYLTGTLADLRSPYDLPDIGKAASLCREAASSGRRIRIIGDYDVDGICSTYILTHGLRNAGADVDFVLPDRMRDGYGLNERMIDDAIQDGIGVILTCDNGISAAGPVRKAKDAGLTVIVTDHHEVPFTLDEAGHKTWKIPEADAVVEPKLQDAEGRALTPFRDICGAAVALKLMQVLYCPKAPGEAFQEEQELFSDLLSFAAFATVCDVMPLIDENRILVKYGLQAAEHTQNVGLRALIEVQGLSGRKLTATHAGFVIGPCLNASGRLDSAERALRLFTDCTDAGEAGKAAEELKELNDSRKTMTERGLKESDRMIREEGLQNDRVLVLYLPGCHESVCGIIAGKVREKYYRPVFVMTDARQEGRLKGSGRSIDTYDMYAEMNRVEDLFAEDNGRKLYGGHRMAAGFTIPKGNLSGFRRRLNENCALTSEDLLQKLHFDMVLSPSELTQDLIREFDCMEPCGNGNRKPLFACRNMTLTQMRELGQHHNTLKFSMMDEHGGRWPVLWFGDPAQMENNMDQALGAGTYQSILEGVCRHTVRAHLAYQPEINDFRGQISIQLMLKDVIWIP